MGIFLTLFGPPNNRFTNAYIIISPGDILISAASQTRSSALTFDLRQVKPVLAAILNNWRLSP